MWLCCVSDDNEENQDTVEQILKCIIENEGKRESSTVVALARPSFREQQNCRQKLFLNESCRWSHYTYETRLLGEQ